MISFNLVNRNFKFINLCNFYKGSKRFFLNLKKLLAGNLESMVKREYGSHVDFLEPFIKSLQSTSAE